jgi:hypothetical protein
MKPYFSQSAMFVALCLIAQSASADGALNSINVGIGGVNPMPHCDARIYTLEYERQASHAFAILGRASAVDYTSDETNYVEDGTLHGVDLGIRYYPAARREGIYTGASAGYWTGEWDFNKNATKPTHQKGEADSHSVRLNFDIGYRYLIEQTNISIIPRIDFGKFFSSSSCHYTAPASQIGVPCDQESVVNGYIFAGVVIGLTF